VRSVRESAADRSSKVKASAGGVAQQSFRFRPPRCAVCEAGRVKEQGSSADVLVGKVQIGTIHNKTCAQKVRGYLGGNPLVYKFCQGINFLLRPGSVIVLLLFLTRRVGPDLPAPSPSRRSGSRSYYQSWQIPSLAHRARTKKVRGHLDGSPIANQSIICLSSGQCYCPSALPQRARPRSRPPDPPPRGRGHTTTNRGNSVSDNLVSTRIVN